MATILYIKNMVCNRCIMVVESILKAEHLTAERVELGMASISETLTEEQKAYPPTERRIANQPVGLPHGTLWTGLQCVKQTVFGNQRHYHRKVFHCPKDRAGKGVARLRRTFTERNS